MFFVFVFLGGGFLGWIGSVQVRTDTLSSFSWPSLRGVLAELSWGRAGTIDCGAITTPGGLLAARAMGMARLGIAGPHILPRLFEPVGWFV